MLLLVVVVVVVVACCCCSLAKTSSVGEGVSRRFREVLEMCELFGCCNILFNFCHLTTHLLLIISYLEFLNHRLVLFKHKHMVLKISLQILQTKRVLLLLGWI